MRYDLSKVHEVNLNILKEIDRICRKYKIKYMLDAGTLLGAIRHQGFIPWDDDVDLAFTRSNYEKFIKVVKKELKEGMTFLDYRDFRQGTAFYDFTSRIIYDKSQTHEHTGEMAFYDGKLNHLWVDLFVMDELPASKINTGITILLQKIIYGMAMGHRYQLDYSKYSFLHKLFVGTLASIGRLIPMSALFRFQQIVAQKDRGKKGELYYYSNYQPDYLYVRVKKEWCEQIEDVPFCDTKLMAPKGWHEILTWIYGDYRKLPPKALQVPAHSSIEIQIYD